MCRPQLRIIIAWYGLLWLDIPPASRFTTAQGRCSNTAPSPASDSALTAESISGPISIGSSPFEPKVPSVDSGELIQVETPLGGCDISAGIFAAPFPINLEATRISGQVEQPIIEPAILQPGAHQFSH